MERKMGLFSRRAWEEIERHIRSVAEITYGHKRQSCSGTNGRDLFDALITHGFKGGSEQGYNSIDSNRKVPYGYFEQWTTLKGRAISSVG